MKKILFLILFMFSLVAFGQEPLKQTVDQMNKEITRLKEDMKQERAEVSRHKKNISYQKAQIKDRQKIIKSIKKYKK